VLYFAVGAGSGGAAIGGLIDGVAGSVVGGAIGIVVGAFTGTIIGSYSWLIDGPTKGAVRCGALMATLMGLLLFVGLASANGWAGIGNAVVVSFGAAAMGGVGGAVIGAFLGWVAGPIFRDAVKEADQQPDRTSG
jgi:hypothetical protein